MLPEVHVDLSQAPANRWQLSSDLQSQAKHLLDSYVADLGGIDMVDWQLPVGDMSERCNALVSTYLRQPMNVWPHCAIQIFNWGLR
jgi:hypothetical protein